MKRIKILSIDFDYFIKATIEERNTKFPNGLDEAPKELLEQMWKEAYEEFPEIKDIGVIRTYDYMCKYLSSQKFEKVLIADSHKEIKQLIDEVPKTVPLVVYNIDFHHDMYHYFTSQEDVNCGNWARKLILEDRFFNGDYVWIKRQDSDTMTLGGEVPCRKKTYLKTALRGIKFDYVFLCKSPEWTPPHLDNKYLEMINCIK